MASRVSRDRDTGSWPPVGGSGGWGQAADDLPARPGHEGRKRWRLFLAVLLAASLTATTVLLIRMVASAEEIRDENGAGVVVGTADPDRLHGGNGADTVRGLGGDDRIWGGKGADHQFGGPGRDRLAGRHNGRDLLNGGPGFDTCVIAPTDNDVLVSCERVIVKSKP